MNEEIIIRAEEVIDENWLPTYIDERNIIYGELINLNMRIFLLEKIESFPFHLFVPLYDDRVFWHQVRNSMVESTIMGAWRIIVDTRDDAITLRHFKNHVFKHLRDENEKQLLASRIKEIDFDNKISALSTKIRNARHNFIGHLNREVQLKPEIQNPYEFSISLSEMRELLETVLKLFNVLCFENYHYIWLWAYSDTSRNRRETDIDRLLDLLAQNSPLIQSPENNPRYWGIKRQKLTESDVAILNEYRRRFGLTEISRDDENTGNNE